MNVCDPNEKLYCNEDYYKCMCQQDYTSNGSVCIKTVSLGQACDGVHELCGADQTCNPDSKTCVANNQGGDANNQGGDGNNQSGDAKSSDKSQTTNGENEDSNKCCFISSNFIFIFLFFFVF